MASKGPPSDRERHGVWFRGRLCQRHEREMDKQMQSRDVRAIMLQDDIRCIEIVNGKETLTD